MHVSKCVFVDGLHLFAGPDCPHGEVEDEQGPIMPEGWTCQR